MEKNLFTMEVSNLNTSSEMRSIRIDAIIENEKNFFAVESDITDLAESIQSQGLLQPLVVRPIEDGKYRLIAGHRRLKALKYLQANDPDHWQTVTCNVVKPVTDDIEELMLIQTNTAARELGWSEKSEAAKRVESILVKLQKEEGVKLPGKMRTHIAKIIKTSEAALARAKVIDDRMIEEFKEAAKSNKHVLNDSMCYQLAQLPPEEQREIYDKVYKKYNYDLTTKWLEEYRQAKAEGKDPFKKKKGAEPDRLCYYEHNKKNGYSPCSVAKLIRKKIVDKTIDEVDRCKVGGCCNSCANARTCKDVCTYANKNRKYDEKALKIGECFRAAREAAGLTRQQCYEIDNSYMMYENGCYHTLTSDILVKFAKVFGCSVDILLGFKPAGFPKGLTWAKLKDSLPVFGRDIYIIFGEQDRCRKVFFCQNGDSAQFCEPGDHSCVLSINYFDVKYWCYPPEVQ